MVYELIHYKFFFSSQSIGEIAFNSGFGHPAETNNSESESGIKSYLDFIEIRNEKQNLTPRLQMAWLLIHESRPLVVVDNLKILKVANMRVNKNVSNFDFPYP